MALRHCWSRLSNGNGHCHERLGTNGQSGHVHKTKDQLDLILIKC
jgi:hypothetical protein